MLGFLLGMISGVIVTLLTMLVLFSVGYNTIGTLLQVFSPNTYIPSIRELKKTRDINGGKTPPNLQNLSSLIESLPVEQKMEIIELAKGMLSNLFVEEEEGR